VAKPMIMSREEFGEMLESEMAGKIGPVKVPG
jgi:hypothetical protein